MWWKWNEVEDPKVLLIVLSAHLWLEQLLDELLNLILINPMKTKNQRFATKVDLAYHIGALKKQTWDALRKINKLRNDLAHDRNRKVEEKDVSDLMDSLPESAKRFVERGGEGRWGLDQLLERTDRRIESDLNAVLTAIRVNMEGICVAARVIGNEKTQWAHALVKMEPPSFEQALDDWIEGRMEIETDPDEDG